MTYSIILACTSNGGIGLNNKIPWYIPADMKHFKTLTTTAPDNKKNVVIMGKNTWLSLPDKYKPLPNRINIVVSSTIYIHEHNQDIVICKSLKEALDFTIENEQTYNIHNVYIIGGRRLYNEAFENILFNKVYCTYIYKPVNILCDTHIDIQLINKQFQLVKKGDLKYYNQFVYCFCEYNRLHSSSTMI